MVAALLFLAGLALIISQLFATTPWHLAMVAGLVLLFGSALRLVEQGEARGQDYARTRIDELKDAYAEGQIDIVEFERSLDALAGVGSPDVQAYREAVRLLKERQMEAGLEQALERRGERYIRRRHGGRMYRYYESGRIVGE